MERTTRQCIFNDLLAANIATTLIKIKLIFFFGFFFFLFPTRSKHNARHNFKGSAEHSFHLAVHKYDYHRTREQIRRELFSISAALSANGKLLTGISSTERETSITKWKNGAEKREIVISFFSAFFSFSLIVFLAFALIFHLERKVDFSIK